MLHLFGVAATPRDLQCKTILILAEISGQSDAQRDTLLKSTSVLVNVDYTIQRMQGTSHVYIPCLCYSVDEGIDHSWIHYLHGMISPPLKHHHIEY